MRVGVFGGSFDPIHSAHLIVAQLAAEQLELDRLHLVVAGSQPHKDGHGAAGPDRLAMVEAAIAGLVGMVADGREIARAGRSYTVDTLAELRGEYPDAELFLLVGADSAGLRGWHRADRVRALATLVSFRRGAESPPPGVSATVDVPAMELSSTSVRRRCAEGRPVRGWVPDAVADYIYRLGLYQGRGGAG